MSKLAIYLTIIAVLDLTAIITAKFWDIKKKPLFLVACMLSMAIASYFFALCLKYESAAIVNLIWIALSTVLVAIFAFLIFKETLTLQQIIGIIIVIIGIIVIEWKN